MPLGQGIVEVLRAIPPRIEVAGHGPTVRVTAGSFDAALEYVRERYDEAVVLDCSLRHRFWSRVTLTVTTDPELARAALPLDAVREQVEQQQTALREAREPIPRPERGWSTLEEIFAGQEQRRQERAARIPTQRHGPGA